MISSAPRGRFRFSLRTLLVLVTVLCIWLAWRGYTTRMRDGLQSRHDAFARALDDYQYADAYQFMAPAFRRKYSVDDFYEQWKKRRIYPFGQEVEITVNPFSSTGEVCNGEWMHLVWVGDRYKWELIDGEWYYTGD